MSGSYLQGRAPELPHQLILPNGEALALQQWLRVLPGQRYVARAQWQGRDVLAKLYVGSKAQRHHARELMGVQALREQTILTPQQLASGASNELCWVLFEFLPAAVSLGEHWQQTLLLPLAGQWSQQEAVIQQALACIARMHQQGLWQSDLHLDNFLQQNGQLYVIDGGGVRWHAPGQPLTIKQALDNLAVFFAQLPHSVDQHHESLLQCYVQHNPAHQLSLQALQQETARIRGWRIRDYLRKTARDCTLFSVQKSGSGLIAVQREQLTAVAELVASPDSFIERGHIYKTGGAATVARVEHQGRQWIIKRYNIKNLMHWLKRCWRPSRAWHSWQAGFLLELEGIAVVPNVAVREQRWFGLRQTAWLVSDYAGEQDLIDRFAPYIENGAVPLDDLQQLQQLLASMLRAKISHGDLKGHNILWHNSRCLLIDLDAVRQHTSHSSFVRAFKRDRARLLRNWPQDSPLYRLLDKKLPQID